MASNNSNISSSDHENEKSKSSEIQKISDHEKPESSEAQKSSDHEKPKCKGRGKIILEKISKESNLQVTFSKRRNGLFKKANELAVLTGVRICVIVFSPSGKAYSFGNLRVEELIQRFITRGPQPSSPIEPYIQAQRALNIQGLISSLSSVENSIEGENERSSQIAARRGPDRIADWSESPVYELNIQQVVQLRLAIQDARAQIQREQMKRWEARGGSYGQQNAGDDGGYNGLPITAPMPAFTGMEVTSSDVAAHGGMGSSLSDPFGLGLVGSGYFYAYPAGLSPFGFGDGPLMVGQSSYGDTGGPFTAVPSSLGDDGIDNSVPITDGPNSFGGGDLGGKMPMMAEQSMFGGYNGSFTSGEISVGDNVFGGGWPITASPNPFGGGGGDMPLPSNIGGHVVENGWEFMTWPSSSGCDGVGDNVPITTGPNLFGGGDVGGKMPIIAEQGTFGDGGSVTIEPSSIGVDVPSGGWPDWVTSFGGGGTSIFLRQSNIDSDAVGNGWPFTTGTSSLGGDGIEGSVPNLFGDGDAGGKMPITAEQSTFGGYGGPFTMESSSVGDDVAGGGWPLTACPNSFGGDAVVGDMPSLVEPSLFGNDEVDSNRFIIAEPSFFDGDMPFMVDPSSSSRPTMDQGGRSLQDENNNGYHFVRESEASIPPHGFYSDFQ